MKTKNKTAKEKLKIIFSLVNSDVIADLTNEKNYLLFTEKRCQQILNDINISIIEKFKIQGENLKFLKKYL